MALTTALLAPVLGATSCQQILGEVELVSSDIGALGLDAGGVSVTPPECVLGTFRCNGAKREICADMVDKTIRWMTQEDCLTPALCEQGLAQTVIICEPPTCGVNDARCDGATPQRCREDLTGFASLEVVCINAGQCSTTSAECPGGAPCCTQGCTPGQLRCNATALERCSDDQESWELIAQCASADLCEQGFAACGPSGANCECGEPVCQPGQTRCSPDNPTTLEVCNAGQTGWQFVDTCATPALCDLGRTRSPLGCEPPACSTEIDEHNCTPNGVLQKCRENRTGFDDVQACAGGAAFCDAVDRTCNPTPCGPGDQRCNGATIEVCRDERTGFDPTVAVCASAALCVNTPPVHCDPPLCAADAFDCFGGPQLQRCNDSRNGFVTVGPPCPRADLCSADRRRCDVCVPNRRECTDDQKDSRTCNAGGTAFGPLTSCPLGCNAATGACDTCVVGAFSCQGNTLKRCNNDAVSSSAVPGNVACEGAARVSCQNGALQRQQCGANGCNQQRLVCNECGGAQRRCAGGATFQQCTANGTFGAAASCDAGLACEGAGLCRCGAGSTRCDGADLLSCSLDRTTFNLADSCDSAAACAAATGTTCADCLQDTCVAGVPNSCVNGRLVPGVACAPGFFCQGPALCRCETGQARCNGGQVTECNPPGTAYVPADACDGRVLRTCNGRATPDTELCDSSDLCDAATPAGCAGCLPADPLGCAEGLVCNPDTLQCEAAPVP